MNFDDALDLILRNSPEYQMIDIEERLNSNQLICLYQAVLNNLYLTDIKFEKKVTADPDLQSYLKFINTVIERNRFSRGSPSRGAPKEKSQLPVIVSGYVALREIFKVARNALRDVTNIGKSLYESKLKAVQDKQLARGDASSPPGITCHCVERKLQEEAIMNMDIKEQPVIH